MLINFYQIFRGFLRFIQANARWYLDQATAGSFRIGSNFPFISHPTIWPYYVYILAAPWYIFWYKVHVQ
jgi:hypothetical protein